MINHFFAPAGSVMWNIMGCVGHSLVDYFLLTFAQNPWYTIKLNSDNKPWTYIFLFLYLFI